VGTSFSLGLLVGPDREQLVDEGEQPRALLVGREGGDDVGGEALDRPAGGRPRARRTV
jgi:hypothetical protein